MEPMVGLAVIIVYLATKATLSDLMNDFRSEKVVVPQQFKHVHVRIDRTS